MNDLRGKGKRKHQDDEKEEEETELERILKKNEYYKRLKEDHEFKAKQLLIPEAKKKKSGGKSQVLGLWSGRPFLLSIIDLGF